MNKKIILALSCFLLFATQTMAASYSFATRKDTQIVAVATPLGTASTVNVYAAAPPLGLASTIGVDITALIKNTWVIETKDINIANALSKWASVAGFKLIWDLPTHILIDAPDSITDTFENALEKVLNSAGVALGDQSLEACFYRNTPQVVRITRKGEQKECQ